jgi:hypothetical protein
MPQTPTIDDLRAAFEHRATWFALLIEEAEKRGLDTSFARDAITRCGCFHAHVKFPKTDDIDEFGAAFATDNVKQIFDATVERKEDGLSVKFHYCPLVAAWEKLGISGDKLAELCDIAMDGDRGILSQFDAFTFKLGNTIAQGYPACELFIGG